MGVWGFVGVLRKVFSSGNDEGRVRVPVGDIVGRSRQSLVTQVDTA